MGGGIALGCQQGLAVFEKVSVGLEGHPFGPALLLTRHRVTAEEIDPFKTGFLHPVGKTSAGGNKIHARGLGVGCLREQREGIIAGNGLRFKDQGATRGEGLVDVTQRIDR